jgi:phosphoribosylformimino-5-aminoimidazole carboxamide ribotide isomerase
MKFIPVIDLKNAQVVAAKKGNRAEYAPSVTPLSCSSQPHEVVQKLLSIYPFDTLYIADLDAISGTGSNFDLIHSLHLKHPDIRFWVDNGLTQLGRLNRFARTVIGSESLKDSPSLVQLCHRLTSPVLSLDFRGNDFIGPADLIRHTAIWPQEVILMTLSRVGSHSGPDLALLARLKQAAPTTNIYAAGGIRNLTDLQKLQKIGVAGALLSTALHQGHIDSTAIEHFSQA